MVVTIIIVYIICSMITGLLLHRFADMSEDPVLETYLAAFFPVVWLYFIIRLPIIIHERVVIKKDED